MGRVDFVQCSHRTFSASSVKAKVKIRNVKGPVISYPEPQNPSIGGVATYTKAKVSH